MLIVAYFILAKFILKGKSESFPLKEIKKGTRLIFASVHMAPWMKGFTNDPISQVLKVYIKVVKSL
ncbi:hypothetical protein DX928_00940 [Bacillus swezeyi]|uniref:Uncharacterized protein n=1 Tax=Bacillus swezeyi TaxID=1925020 RepID=A0A5M8RNT2_9BACI|nr:hypothetical protein DX927_18930 [Bacillus swezeyi]KAA6481744.1 hypothetical protein DX928_00940 [Bacillus swezeyi]